MARGSERIPRLAAPSGETLSLLLPAVAAAVYLLVLALNLRHAVGGLYTSADLASAPVIATLLERTPSEQSAVLGNYPWYESLWFLRATEGFPHHRQLWEAAPIALYLATVGLVAGAAWAALGRWAGVVTAAALIALSGVGRLVFFAPNSHGTTAAHAALLAAALVLLARRAGRLRAWQLAAVGLGLGLVTAVGVASDDLMLPAAIGPAAGTAALLWWKVPRLRSAALAMLGACAVALVLGDMLANRTADSGIQHLPFELRFLAGDQIVNRIEGLVRASALLAGGDIFNLPVNRDGLGRLLALVLVAAGAWLVGGELRRRIRGPGALRRAPELRPEQVGLLAHAGFWGLSAAATITAFVLGNQPADGGGARYLVTTWLALGALLGLLAIRPGIRRLAISAGAALFVLASTFALARDVGKESPDAATRAEVNALARYAEQMGVRHGLAGYWTSANITWATHFRLELLAVRQCEVAGRRFCPINLHRVDSAYRPQGGRSMFVVDDRYLGMIAAPDPAYGRPVGRRRIGRLQVFVYRYDLRLRLGAG